MPRGIALPLFADTCREQRRARGGALGIVVELREAHALARQPLEVRRANLAAVGADVRKTHVIGQDEQNIGRLAGLSAAKLAAGSSTGSRSTRQPARASSWSRTVMFSFIERVFKGGVFAADSRRFNFGTPAGTAGS